MPGDTQSNILVSMLRKNRLFTPGPTPLFPAAQLAMASYTAHHRTAEFRALFARVLGDLKEFIGTQNDVLVLTASGTGFMEAVVSNLTSSGDKVLVLAAGAFGERWVSLAKAFGCDVQTVRAAQGQTFDLEGVQRKLGSDVRCVYMQATESSTGVRHDVQGVAKLVRAMPDTLLIVDAITGLGTTRFDVDGWGLDVILGGSQKALMIPPGLSYGAVSERAWQRMDKTLGPRYYFDLRRERKAAEKCEAAFTPATTLFAALAAVFDFLREAGNGSVAAGRDVLIETAELCAAMTRAGAKALALELLAKDSQAAALTAILSPEGVDSGQIIKNMREQFGAVLANGQGDMKGKLFRVAHLGYYDYLDTVGVLAALEHVISEITGKRVEFGCAVRAAQQAYTERASRTGESQFS